MGLTIPSLFVGGNLGNIVGAGSDGVLAGILTAKAPTKVFLKTHAQAVLCKAEDGNAYTDYVSEANEATGDDVVLLPDTPVANDATYLGHATKQINEWRVQVTTAGASADSVLAFEYFNGTAWAAVTNLSDASDGFRTGAAWYTVTFDAPVDWAKCLVDDTLGYWVRWRVTTAGTWTIQPLGGQAYGIAASADATWTDDTTDFNDADAGDVACLPAFPVVGDGLYVVDTEKFCKAKVTLSQAAVATWTVTPKYWDGSAWSAITTYDDDTTGFTAGTSTYYLHFVPPSDWASTTVNGQAGYAITFEITAFTSLTTQPLATQGWVLPLVTGAVGMGAGISGTITEVNSSAQTKSAANTDSVFLLINVTQGTFISFTWTKAVAADSTTGLSLAVTANDELVLVQVTEDGSTEFANANFWFDLDT